MKPLLRMQMRQKPRNWPVVGLILMLLGFSVKAAAKGGGTEIDNILPVGGGIVHTSYIGATDADPLTIVNGIGFSYNSGVKVYLNGATPNNQGNSGGTSAWDYKAGLAFGSSQIGGGVAFVGNSAASSSSAQSVNWGLGGQLTEDFALGIAGNNAVSTISALLNSSGTNRFGLMVINPFTAVSNGQSYGLGYAYEGKKATLALGSYYTPLTSSGNMVAGFGVHAESFQIICNYNQAYSSNSNSNNTATGLATFGVGFEIGSSVNLALTYSSALYSALLAYNF